jgi:hypothetical protein
MERQDKPKPSAKVAKTASQAKSDSKLTDISVKRTAVRAAKPGAKAAVKKAARPVSTEQRRQLIAEAAYFRALSRGFAGGDPVADWLDAEREVNQALGKTVD